MSFKDPEHNSATMRRMSALVFCLLLSTGLSAPVKAPVEVEREMKFHGEDLHISLPSLQAEVTFQPSTGDRVADVVLMRGGEVVPGRATLNAHTLHLIVNNVNETNEGVYTLKDPDAPEDVRRIRLIVRDCTNEETVRYWDTYHIHLMGVTPRISLEFRPLAVEANLTSSASQMVLTSTGVSQGRYVGRITKSEHMVSVSATTGADEGSYTVRDANGIIKKKICLDVKEHYSNPVLPYDGVLKINLILDGSQVSLYYNPNNASQPLLLMEKGVLTKTVSEVGMEDRLVVEGSVVELKHLRASDAGNFRVLDSLGFLVAELDLGIESYKLPMVFVAVIALCGLLAFLLLVCLLSCLFKVKKRARRAAELEKLAQNSGKEEEGDAFRQVVKNIKQLNDDSKHSQADNTEKSQSTEVDIKGLEVSSKEVGVDNMETSDSGVGFNTTALPLDTDTDVADQIPDSDAGSISVAAATKPSPPAATAAVTKPSAPPAVEVQPPAADATTKSSTEPQLDIPTFADVKLSPAQSPEPKAGAALKASSPMVPSAHTAPPTPESKPALTPTPDSVPTVNGTPEPAPGSKASPEAAPKVAPPKTPEVEVKVGQAEEGTATT